MLSSLFGSKARFAVLSTLALNPSGAHLREIARKAGIQPISAKRELDKFVKSGLATEERRGNQRIFRLGNSKVSRLLAELVSTDAVSQALSLELGKVGKIEICFIFGSKAKNEDNVKSDIDIFIIGEPDLPDVAKKLRKVEEITGKEVNPIMISEKEFKEKVKEKNPFISRVRKEEKIFIVGDEDGLAKIA